MKITISEDTRKLAESIQREARARVRRSANPSVEDILISNFSLEEALALAEVALRGVSLDD